MDVHVAQAYMDANLRVRAAGLKQDSPFTHSTLTDCNSLFTHSTLTDWKLLCLFSCSLL